MQYVLGDRVRVNTATGERRKGRVIGFGEGVVYVTTEEEYLKTRHGEHAPGEWLTDLAVGFPTEDVEADTLKTAG